MTVKIERLKDSGLSTYLSENGFDVTGPLWTARALKEAPDLIFNFHGECLLAGANVILTASYQASVQGFLKYGMYFAEARECIFQSVMLAVEARHKFLQESKLKATSVLVGGSVGPYGAILANGAEYRGDYDLKHPDVHDYYLKKIEILAAPRKRARVDFLAFETVPTIEEGQLIIEKMAGYPNLPYVLSFSRPLSLATLIRSGVLAKNLTGIGWNCQPMNVINEIYLSERNLLKDLNKEILIWPNDLSKDNYNLFKLATDAEDFSRLWLGGCCGVSVKTLADVFSAQRECE